MTNTTVEKGHTVTLHYKGTFDDGEEFDNSRGREEPMTVTVGGGQLIKGFDQALEGMLVGETKTFTVPFQDAYGPRLDERTTQMPKSSFPPELQLEEGAKVPLQGPDGQPFIATVSEIVDHPTGDAVVTFDLNHPMAGHNLTFEVEVLGVDSAVVPKHG